MNRALALACVVLCATLAYSQTETQYLKTKALQFSFNGLNLSSVGGGIGGKLWVDDRTALVLAIGGSHSYSSSDANTQQYGRTTSSSILQLQFGLESHTFLSNEFSPYVTGAIFGRYDNQDYKTTYPPPTTSAESKYKSTNIGFLASFGAEYWISSRFSLAGQQTFQMSYAFGSQEEISNVSTTQKTHGFNAGIGTSSLILSIYF